jgi:hypothetical protein
MVEDEDHLDREDSLATLYRALRRGGEPAARNAAALGEIIGGRMADCSRRGDVRALERWYRTCRELVRKIDQEGTNVGLR